MMGEGNTSHEDFYTPATSTRVNNDEQIKESHTTKHLKHFQQDGNV